MRGLLTSRYGNRRTESLNGEAASRGMTPRVQPRSILHKYVMKILQVSCGFLFNYWWPINQPGFQRSIGDRSSRLSCSSLSRQGIQNHSSEYNNTVEYLKGQLDPRTSGLSRQLTTTAKYVSAATTSNLGLNARLSKEKTPPPISTAMKSMEIPISRYNQEAQRQTAGT